MTKPGGVSGGGVCTTVCPGVQSGSQELVSVQPGSCLENPPTRLLLGPRAHTKAQKEKSTLPHKALEMRNFGEGGKAASSPGQLVPS